MSQRAGGAGRVRGGCARCARRGARCSRRRRRQRRKKYLPPAGLVAGAPGAARAVRRGGEQLPEETRLRRTRQSRRSWPRIRASAPGAPDAARAVPGRGGGGGGHVTEAHMPLQPAVLAAGAPDALNAARAVLGRGEEGMRRGRASFQNTCRCGELAAAGGPGRGRAVCAKCGARSSRKRGGGGDATRCR